MNTELVARLVARWSGPNGRPLSGKLIDRNKVGGGKLPPDCMCAQGWALYESGMSPSQIEAIAQSDADREVATRLGISRAHAVLLRQINDGRPDSPSVVLTNPAVVLGDQAHTVLAFWHHLDRMSRADWQKGYAARDAARDAAWVAAWDAARVAAWDAAGGASWVAARAAARDASWVASWVAARATNEIQGARVMRERGQPFVFLPMFGFAAPEEIPQ